MITTLLLVLLLAAGCDSDPEICALDLCEHWRCGAPRPACPCETLCERRGCSELPVFVRDPETAECFEAESSCDVPEEWEAFDRLEDCETGARSCRSDADCGDERCDLRSCGDSDLGLCVTIPEECPEALEPVRGCDGQTYSSDCDRLRAGARLDPEVECSLGPVWIAAGDECVALDSECDVPRGVEIFLSAEACDRAEPACSTRADCAPGQICDRLGCGDDAAGRCVPEPGACGSELSIGETSPRSVCGCDGVTYETDCDRVLGGTALAHLGACGA